LGDFGLSSEKSGDKSVFMSCVGTPLYMSPDVWEGQYDLNSDVW